MISDGTKHKSYEGREWREDDTLCAVSLEEYLSRTVVIPLAKFVDLTPNVWLLPLPNAPQAPQTKCITHTARLSTYRR